jgi:ATP-dependent Lhr-like helicase
VVTALEALEGRSRLERGAFRPGGHEREWVDAEVLQRLRRRSLAALRRGVEAVDHDAFGRFTVAWHGIGARGSSPGRVLDVIRRIQGTALPASTLEGDILAARLDYSPDLLDSLTASGEVVWVGRGPLGGRDGRVALYLRDHVPALHWATGDSTPDGPAHERIRAWLGGRGASFFRDLYEAAGGGDPESTLAAIWDLVWAGEVTNDTLAPLRAFLWGRVRKVPGAKPVLPTLRCRRPVPIRCSSVMESSSAMPSWPRESLEDSPACTRCSRRSRKLGGSAGGTSSKGSGGHSLRFPAPSTA